MDSRIIMKPGALPVIARAPVNPPSSFGQRVGLLRSEFLGCDHNLRRPGDLQSYRRKCKKMKLRSNSHYYKNVIRVSLDSQPTLVFPAVATFSALAVVFFTYSKKQFDAMQMAGQLILALSEQIRSIMSWIITDENSEDLRRKTNGGDAKSMVKGTRESNQVFSEIEFGETDTIHRDTPITKESTFQSNVVSSSGQNFVTDGTHEIMELSSISTKVNVPSFLTEIREVHLDGPAATESSGPVSKSHMRSSASTTVVLQAESDNLGGKVEILKEGDVSRYNLYLRDSPQKELPKIDEASLQKLDSLEPLLSYATIHENSASLSFANNSLMEGSSVTAPENVLPTVFPEKMEGLPLGSRMVQEKGNGLGKGKWLSNKRRIIFHLDSQKKLFPSFSPKANHVKGKHNPSWQLHVYNQLLREGRLNNCIELLEELEEKGLLDMDKVYHVRFFDVCKRQRAVKEAFRFIKLIPNPTLSTFNLLMSVCAGSQDSEGASKVMQHVVEAGLKADCKLYTTLISTYAKCGQVDTMFKVFHEMVNAGVEPNVHTYGALIDGCAKAGQVAKAFGAYGINVKPDRVVFNALITACGQSGAVDRAFDVLAEMRTEIQPIDPDHVTIGALMKACARADRVDRAREVYNMIHEYGIKGSAELYTIAVNSCSHHGDWEFAYSVYADMIKNNIAPDEMFISALIDVAGHAGKVDAAFEILEEARAKGIPVGIISYSSLMGACSNARDVQKALELYKVIKGLNIKPTVSMMNALINALCDGDKLEMAIKTLLEMKDMGLSPNTITYSVLLVASDNKDDLEAGLKLISEAKKDGVAPNLVMCRCILAMCLSRFQKACKFGDPVLSFSSGQLQIDSKWTSLALKVYRETIAGGVTPTLDELSKVLGCLQLPHDVTVRKRFIENVGVHIGIPEGVNIYSFINGFGEFDPRAISLVEEAATLGVVPFVSLKDSPIVIDARNLKHYTAEVYFLTVLKGLKYRSAAGAKLPNITVLLPVKSTQIKTPAGEKTINLTVRISQSLAGVLRRLGIAYLGNESYGKIRINGVSIRRWFEPKLESSFTRSTTHQSLSYGHLSSGIIRQQRTIRSGLLSLE
ncbi:Pentatricopeptide repeat-containing protein [Dorcoceras hygrometricum]|uniref:Pentatricopeptide repeat-containing protein n=1 Tax=Dorcoceras hygrometricum TaxID=472368 RepID=A0A2Z7D266_9LAMI|nr:Pentatricopeptide repeat-containing protein [Dorcoceras hygrometricum]